MRKKNVIEFKILDILENSAIFSYQLKNAPVLSSSSSAPRALPRRNENIYVHKKTCARVFIATLFVIAKHYKQSKYLPAGDWIKALYIHI